MGLLGPLQPGRADVVVIGGGAVGSSVALHTARRGLRTVVLEKESGPALHQSGRNSGVIHAGYNLKPGSEKARFCIEGSRRLRAYCAERGVPVRQHGILVVARTEPERAVLAELSRRAKANGVATRMLDETGIREVEPEAAGIEALQATEGASFDARTFVHLLTGDAIAAGARFLYDTRALAIHDPSLDGGHDSAPIRISTSKGPLEAGAVVNCAGLFADRLAAQLAPDLRIVPFRGYYAELRPGRSDLVRSHIYAAPDLAFPFLGVHLSRRTDGRVIVGPGAMLAFGREAYRFHEVNARDMLSTVGWPGFWRMLVRRDVRSLMRSEVAKSLSLKAIWKEASLLVRRLEPTDLVRSYAGNRAQVVDRAGRLVEDIVVRETARAVHVLNAVSPGLTCSLPFGEYLAERAAACARPGRAM